MTAHRDQSVSTARLDAGYVVLMVDVDPAGLSFAARRALADLRDAWGRLEADGDRAPKRRRSEASGPPPGPLTPETPREAPQRTHRTPKWAFPARSPTAWDATAGPERHADAPADVPRPRTTPEPTPTRTGPLSPEGDPR